MFHYCNFSLISLTFCNFFVALKHCYHYKESDIITKHVRYFLLLQRLVYTTLHINLLLLLKHRCITSRLTDIPFFSIFSSTQDNQGGSAWVGSALSQCPEDHLWTRILVNLSTVEQRWITGGNISQTRWRLINTCLHHKQAGADHRPHSYSMFFKMWGSTTEKLPRWKRRVAYCTTSASCVMSYVARRISRINVW